MKIFTVFMIFLFGVAIAFSDSNASKYGSEITDIIKKLVGNIPKVIRRHGGSFNVPLNKYIQGKVNVDDTVTTGLSKVEVKVISHDRTKKLVQLFAKFPKVQHNGVYHNNVTILKSDKRVEDTTDIKATLDGVFISIRCNIDNQHVWNLEANTTAKAGNVKISGFLNDEKISQELSKKLTQNLPDLFYRHEHAVTVFLSPILERAINKLYHS